MTEEDDRLLEILSALPRVTPDAQRASRVRARCHSAISRQALERARKSKRHWRSRLVDLAGAAALCIYLAVAIAEAVRLTGSP